jgi:hypothetical protein
MYLLIPGSHCTDLYHYIIVNKSSEMKQTGTSLSFLKINEPLYLKSRFEAARDRFGRSGFR